MTIKRNSQDEMSGWHLRPYLKCPHISKAMDAIIEQELKMEDDYNNGTLICEQCNCYYQAAEEVGYGETKP